MPYSIRLATLFAKSKELYDNGQIELARHTIFVAEEVYRREEETLNDQEKMMIAAAFGVILQQLELAGKAVVFMEEACALSLKLEPNSSMTYGDFWTLVELYEELGRFQDALEKLLETQSLCQRVSPEFFPNHQRKIQVLTQKIREASPDLTASIVCTGINYSLFHSGINPFQQIIISNEADIPVSFDVQLEVVGYSFAPSVIQSVVPPHGKLDVCPKIHLHLDHTKLQGQIERAKTQVRFKGTPAITPTMFETWVLAFNECSLDANHAHSLAAFVHPNNAAIKLIQTAIPQDDDRISKEKINQFIEQAYAHIQDNFDLLYDFEPPCWESTSQRVRFPDEILVARRGTCLDLALLFAGLIENGLHRHNIQPVIILIKGNMYHALTGCWLEETPPEDEILMDKEGLTGWIEQGKLLVFEPTGITPNGPFWNERASYQEACQKAKALIQASSEILAVNVGAARVDIRTGRPLITPIPYRNEPPYGEAALQVFYLTQNAWKKCPTSQLQSTHLLAGLVEYKGLARQFFDTLAKETGNPLVQADALHDFIMDGLKQKIAGSPEIPVSETESYMTTVQQAKQEARKYGALLVDDLHLLLALLRTQASSVAKVFHSRGTGPKECLSYLELLHPPQKKPSVSEFPSEVF